MWLDPWSPPFALATLGFFRLPSSTRPQYGFGAETRRFARRPAPHACVAIVVLLVGAGSLNAQISASRGSWLLAPQAASGLPSPYQSGRRHPNSSTGDSATAETDCYSPYLRTDLALLNVNRRTTGLVNGEGSFNAPVQQTEMAFGLERFRCDPVTFEAGAWYSLHNGGRFEEKRFYGRAVVEIVPKVRVYGGIAYYDNPPGLFASRAVYLFTGGEYPTFWGLLFSGEYKRDYFEHGDWLTLQLRKSHQLGSWQGAVFRYDHAIGATGTRDLPANSTTPGVTGIPSIFYRAMFEIDDGPVTWYFEASPHISYVSRTTGVRKHQMLFAFGLRTTFPWKREQWRRDQ